jgi:hypothetical protein
MKKKMCIFLFVVGLTFMDYVGLACSGTYAACGMEDVMAHADDFANNCPGGSTITVVNYCTGSSNPFGVAIYVFNIP